MKMTEDVINALKNRNESKLYHAMYDIYDENNSTEACEAFNQWKLEAKEYERNMIIRAERMIYKNEADFNSMFYMQ